MAENCYKKNCSVSFESNGECFLLYKFVYSQDRTQSSNSITHYYVNIY